MKAIKYYEFFVIVLLLTFGSCKNYRNKDTDGNSNNGNEILPSPGQTPQSNIEAVQPTPYSSTPQKPILQSSTSLPLPKNSLLTPLDSISQSSISRIPDEMIVRARTYHKYFLAKKLKELKNEVAEVNINEKNTEDAAKKTALHDAAELGEVDIIEALLDNEPDIDERDKIDNTPLHYAAEKDNERVVELLIKAGANAQLRGTYNNQTVFELMNKMKKSKTDHEIINLLSELAKK